MIFAAVVSASLAMPFATSAEQLVVPQQPTGIEIATPESMGMSSPRLDLISRAFTKEIEDK
jgi:hypothetical protein